MENCSKNNIEKLMCEIPLDTLQYFFAAINNVIANK